VVFSTLHGERHNNIKRYYRKNLCPDEMSNIHQLLMGTGLSQNFYAVYFFEQYIRENKFEYVVELGSCHGALSLYLGNYASVTEQFLFHTFEMFPDDAWNNRTINGGGHWFEKLEKISPYMKSFKLDVLGQEAKDIIKAGIGQYKTLIICDNGQKRREFRNYAPMLKSGDKIIVHDWMEEIFPKDVTDVMTVHNIVFDDAAIAKLESYKTTLMPFVKL
jgi:hypothetical protein